ncbi:ABC transporter ATP-binding protein [bacterium]|nr:ABC transporter ATP-binding protein [bacterium]
MDSQAILIASQVSKTFQKKGAAPIEVLKGVDFEVKAGESIAIVGKSGSGKSTLLHLLGTLEQPSAGKVYFLGQDLTRFNERRLATFRNKEIGFVFQFHYLMVEFSALENVMMPALISGVAARPARELAESLLEKVGLADRATHKPSELSGGEQQRVAIARALILRPKVLLTDEMTGNLDPATGAQVFELIQKMHMEFGTAIISVTHDDALARQYGKIYRLKEGRLAKESRH